jgi:hypothetical protein
MWMIAVNGVTPGPAADVDAAGKVQTFRGHLPTCVVITLVLCAGWHVSPTGSSDLAGQAAGGWAVLLLDGGTPSARRGGRWRLCALVGPVRSGHDRLMKKSLFLVALLVGLAALGKRFGATLSGLDWEKRFARMPDNAPPKWMFRNISAIRENTDRILELVDRDRPSSTESSSAST